MKEIQPRGFTHCTPLYLHLTMVKIIVTQGSENFIRFVLI